MNLALPAAQRRRALLRFWGLALLGSAVLAASAQVVLPAWPVPATLQSLAVLLLGALGGARLGTAAVALYLLEGTLGLPVFAGGGAGPAALAGPTGVLAAMGLSGLLTVVSAALRRERVVAHGPAMLAAAWAVGLAGVAARGV